MIGETLGNYRLISKIGQGGMGVVYLAEHAVMRRKAAVKVLLPAFCARPDTVTRFFNEARATANLRHPSLVDVFDCGTHEGSGSAYIVMDHLVGETLGDRLRKGEVVAPADAAAYTRQIAAGLAVAHAAGIVHRDLKPDNVFLVRGSEPQCADTVKVLDFGVAKLLQDDQPDGGVTKTGTVIGTPMFMAPEQCRGSGSVDHRADLYSLGAIVYTMLCGRPPFDYQFTGELIGAHLHETPRPLIEHDPKLPLSLSHFVDRALEKDPQRRYQTAAEFVAALDAAMADAMAETDGREPESRPAPQLLAPRLPVPRSDAPVTTVLPVSPALANDAKPQSRPPRSRSRVIAGIAGACTGIAAVAVVLFVRMKNPQRGEPASAGSSQPGNTANISVRHEAIRAVGDDLRAGAQPAAPEPPQARSNQASVGAVHDGGVKPSTSAASSGSSVGPTPSPVVAPERKKPSRSRQSPPRTMDHDPRAAEIPAHLRWWKNGQP